MIKFNFTLTLFFYLSSFGSLFSKCLPNFEKYNKLYKEGSSRIEKELDLVKIIKDLRTLKIIVKNLFLDPEFKLEIDNYKKNIIDLDEEDGEKDGFSSVDKSFQSNEDV